MDNSHRYDENELVEILPPVGVKCISTGRWTAVSGGESGWEGVGAGEAPGQTAGGPRGLLQAMAESGHRV